MSGDASQKLNLESPRADDEHAAGDDNVGSGLEAVLEAVLFAADKPMSNAELVEVLRKSGDEDPRIDTVDAAIVRLNGRLSQSGSSLTAQRVAGGWELRTLPGYGRWIQHLYEKRPVKLTRASLEVAAVVAYRQPCTRAVVDDIRGVDSSSTLRQLLKLGVLKILGRADDVGRPIVYGTSDEFLRVFGLESLTDLPTLREFSELSEEHMLTLAELDASNDELNEAADAGEEAKPAIDASWSGPVSDPDDHN